MRVKIGRAKRATWVEMLDTYRAVGGSVLFDPTHPVVVGGWTADNHQRKITIALDDKEARDLFEKLSRRYDKS